MSPEERHERRRACRHGDCSKISESSWTCCFPGSAFPTVFQLISELNWNTDVWPWTLLNAKFAAIASYQRVLMTDWLTASQQYRLPVCYWVHNHFDDTISITQEGTSRGRGMIERTDRRAQNKEFCSSCVLVQKNCGVRMMPYLDSWRPCASKGVKAIQDTFTFLAHRLKCWVL